MARRLKTRSPYLTWAADMFEAGPPVDSASVERGWVMGLAMNYPAEALAGFVKSLRAHFQGRATLVVSDDPEVLALLRVHAIEAVVAPAPARWTPHFVVERFGLFARWLAAAPAETPVLLTDVRDVVFQGPPFQPPLADIEAFPEGEQVLFAEHAFNVRYAEALVGRALSAKLDPFRPLCVGTIVGRAGPVLALLRTMLLLMAIPRSGRGGAFGADQAAFNLAIHLGLVEAEVRRNYSRVSTLGWPDSAGASAREDGVIVNPDGTISPIVHQYDRRADLAEAVARRWGVQPVVRIGRISLRDRWIKAVNSLRKRLPDVR